MARKSRKLYYSKTTGFITERNDKVEGSDKVMEYIIAAIAIVLIIAHFFGG